MRTATSSGAKTEVGNSAEKLVFEDSDRNGKLGLPLGYPSGAMGIDNWREDRDSGRGSSLGAR